MRCVNLIFVLCLGCFSAYGDDRVLSRVRRIIGGTPLADGEAPYLTFVLTDGTSRSKRSIFWSSFPWTTDPPGNYDDPEAFCTGSLVNEQWALTAAHCFDGTTSGVSLNDPSVWKLKLGTVSLRKTKGKGNRFSWFNKQRFYRKTNAQSPQYVAVDRIVRHPDYTEASLSKDDIALVRLREPVVFDAYVSNIELNSDSNYPPDGTECFTQGWGCTKNDGPASRVARTVDIPIYDSEDCSNVVDIKYGFCAGFFDENKGVCSGDSGGPLICERDGNLLQVGITSLANNVDPGNYPAIFVRVSKYIEWIRSITG